MKLKLKEKQKKSLLVIVLIVLSMFILSTQLSVYLPQTDISYYINQVKLRYENGDKYTLYPSKPSFSKTGSDDEKPDVTIAINIRDVVGQKQTNITFKDKKYAVYSYDCLFDVEIKAVSDAPGFYNDKWYLPATWHADGWVEIEVYLTFKSRGDWVLLYVFSKAVREEVRWTSAEIPDSNWDFKKDGYANALEPTADNQLLTVLVDGEEDPTYYYEPERLFSAGKIDGKGLYMKAKLLPPSAGWIKRKLTGVEHHYAFGESIVYVSFIATVAIAEEIPPEQTANINKLNDTRPKVEPYGEPPAPIIPPFIQYVIIAILIITAVYVIFSSIGKIKPSPKISVGGVRSV